jgi:hypothetical protein
VTGSVYIQHNITKEIIGNLLVLSDAFLGERHCLLEGPVGRIESTLRRATCLTVVLDFRVDELEFLLQLLLEQFLPLA